MVTAVTIARRVKPGAQLRIDSAPGGHRRAGQKEKEYGPQGFTPSYLCYPPSPHPHVRPARRPNFGVRRPEQCQHRCAHGRRQMRDSRIVPDEHPRLRQPAGQFIEIVDAHRTGQRRVVLPGAVRIDDLYELACWLAKARVFIGNDSGITHLAAAVGTPVLALFGPTDPEVWAPPDA